MRILILLFVLTASVEAATLYANASGALIGVRLSAAEETKWPDVPAGTASTLTFDEDTNTALVADLRINSGSYTLLAGVLRKSGVVQVINADSSDRTARNALQAVIPKLRNDTATDNERNRVLLVILRILRDAGLL